MQLKCIINNFSNCPGFKNCIDYFPDSNVPVGGFSCIHETFCSNKREQDIEDKLVEDYYKRKQDKLRR